VEGNESILTSEGYEKIKKELEELKGPRRRELAERLKVAISYGDLRENSEYHSAKDEQAFVETRILTLERLLRTARVVDAGSVQGNGVGIGSVVVLKDIEFAETIEYQIVGPAEANVADNKISYESPLGRELIGKRVGDKIHVNAPAGVIEYELLEIKS